MNENTEKRYTFTGLLELLEEINTVLIKEKEALMEMHHLELSSKQRDDLRNFPVEARKLWDRMVSFVMKKGRLPLGENEYAGLGGKYCKESGAPSIATPYNGEIASRMIERLSDFLVFKKGLGPKSTFEALSGWSEVETRKEAPEKRYTFDGRQELLSAISEDIMHEKEVLEVFYELSCSGKRRGEELKNFPIDGEKILDSIISFVMKKDRLPASEKEGEALGREYCEAMGAPSTETSKEIAISMFCCVKNVLLVMGMPRTKSDFEKLPGWSKPKGVAFLGMLTAQPAAKAEQVQESVRK